jgi:hypothetical protein
MRIDALRYLPVVLVPAIACAGVAPNARGAKPADAAVTYTAPHAERAPRIDGVADDPAWQQAEWRAIDAVLLGDPPRDAADFSGRYKAVWRADALYLLAEIHDDHLVDTTPDPLQKYWDDDALEIFVDADNSGGGHQFDHQAFAYHIALDNQAVDVGPFASDADAAAGRASVHTYPDHVQARWQRAATPPHPILWEVRLALYPPDYRDLPGDGAAREHAGSTPLVLAAGQRIGFMLAWCDSDVPGAGREHFIADVDVPPVNGDRNRGWIDADVFGVMLLAPAQ